VSGGNSRANAGTGSEFATPANPFLQKSNIQTLTEISIFVMVNTSLTPVCP
jgi:hypothetical protein